MAFAEIRSDLSYWRKQEKPLFPDLEWNIPEQKTGRLDLIGGNSQGFNTLVRLAEYAEQQFPLRTVRVLLPETLRGKLPPLTNFAFAAATESGSFAKSAALRQALEETDFAILAGDVSRNSATAVALTEAIQTAAQVRPLLVTRDAVDLLVASFDSLLLRPELFVVASMAQLQKVFRAVYYPRMIMLSQPLLPTIETLHKFTLSYPVTIVTFHQENIIVAQGGEVVTTPIARTEYSPITLWSGRLAVKIAALNLYNPQKSLEATAAAVML